MLLHYILSNLSSCVVLCSVVLCWYLAVQLLVQLADALGQLGQLLCDDSMVNSLSGVCLHVEVLGQEVRVALCKHKHKHKHSSSELQYSHTLTVCTKHQARGDKHVVINPEEKCVCGV